MKNITTTNLSDFGIRELIKLRDLIDHQINDGLPKDFWNSDVTPMMNTISGNVFLTNSEYQTAMVNPETDRLEMFYYLSYSGTEGFLNELIEMYDDGNITDIQDIQELIDLCDCNDLDDERDRIIQAELDKELYDYDEEEEEEEEETEED